MILYLDSSALVKLFVEEAYADNVRRAVAQADLICCHAIGSVEVRSAFARKYREGAISREDAERARKQFIADWATLYVVATEPALLNHAGDLTEKHGLRAYDSVHLAAALKVLHLTDPSPLFRFLTFDAAQARAATLEGLPPMDEQE